MKKKAKKAEFKSIATLTIYPLAGLSERAAAKRVISWLLGVCVQIEMEHRTLPKTFRASLLEPVKEKKGGGR